MVVPTLEMGDNTLLEAVLKSSFQKDFRQSLEGGLARKTSLEKKARTLIREGPLVGAQLVLFDEISRTSDVVQAALFSALEEGEFMVADKIYPMDELFTVLATRNIYDTRGVRPLSFAFADRFCLSANITRPSFEEECKIAVMPRDDDFQKMGVQKVLRAEDVAAIRKFVRTMRLMPDDHPIARYVVRLVRNTDPYIPANESIARKIQAEVLRGRKLELEASPRASQWFTQLAAVYVFCILQEKQILPEHVQYLAKPVLRHRLVFRGLLDHQSIYCAEQFIDAAIKRTPVFA
jgi:MoxR-like ATPase